MTNLEMRSRYFRLLLYPDNPLHQAAIDKIQAYQVSEEYLGIKHRGIDGDKEHFHFVLFFENPRCTASLCRSLGFIDCTDLPDDQFVRAITKKQNRKVDSQLKDCCVYLTHRNAPEKEQYPSSDLFGSEDKINYTCKQIIKCESQNFDMSDAVYEVLEWIRQQDGYIKVYSFGKWLCRSPYFKANGNKIVWAALREHNLNVYSNKSWVPEKGFDTVVPDFREMTEEESAELSRMGFIFGGD